MGQTKANRKTSKVGRFFKRFFLVLLFLILTIGIVVGGVISGALLGYVETVDLIDIHNMKLNLTSFVYATNSEGETVELERLYDDENRIWVDLDDIPVDLQHAFVSIEDERFYKHHGFDTKRFIGAAFTYVKNKLKHDDSPTYGGSTITQQLIKNLTDEDDYSIKRKIQEMYRAWKLEQELSKDEILEYYLNTIFLSQRCNGVASASNVYFGKSVSDLTLAESACIAAITQFPTKFDPLLNPDNNKQRRQTILGKMLELGYITQAQYDEAKDEELHLQTVAPEEEKKFQSYYVDAAIDQIIQDLIEQKGYTKSMASRVLYNGGLRIYLAQDMEMQATLDGVFRDDSNFPKGAGEVQPEASMVIIDQHTGYIRALVGGRGEKTGNRMLNRATQTLRQPGSTIKPISVYAPALEYGFVTPSTIVSDTPVSYGDWKPKNVDNSFRGNITIRTALALSRNIPAVRVCDLIGADTSFNFMARNLHISSIIDYEERNGKTFSDKGLASLALGGLTDGVSVLEMAAAYVPFDNDGFYITPSTYTRVTDSEGNLVLENKCEPQIAMSEDTAYEMTQMLQAVVTSGSGTMAAFRGMNIAGKTGTTSDSYDRWFIGYTPYYVGAVWFGYDQPASLSRFSSNPAARVWKAVMEPIHENLENKKFEAPGNTVSVMVCAESGELANPNCTELVSELYSSRSVPKKRCTIHTESNRKSSSSLLDSKYHKTTSDDAGSSSSGSASSGSGSSGSTTKKPAATEAQDTPSGGNASTGSASGDGTASGTDTGSTGSGSVDTGSSGSGSVDNGSAGTNSGNTNSGNTDSGNTGKVPVVDVPTPVTPPVVDVPSGNSSVTVVPEDDLGL